MWRCEFLKQLKKGVTVMRESKPWDICEWQGCGNKKTSPRAKYCDEHRHKACSKGGYSRFLIILNLRVKGGAR